MKVAYAKGKQKRLGFGIPLVPRGLHYFRPSRLAELGGNFPHFLNGGCQDLKNGQEYIVTGDCTLADFQLQYQIKSKLEPTVLVRTVQPQTSQSTLARSNSTPLPRRNRELPWSQ